MSTTFFFAVYAIFKRWIRLMINTYVFLDGQTTIKNGNDIITHDFPLRFP